MEANDRSLMTLLEDIQTFGCFIWTTLGFVFASSYYCGKYLTELVAILVQCIWHSFCGAAEILKALFHAVLELEESLIRGIFSLQYHCDQLYEAFQITMNDLAEFSAKLFYSNISAVERFLVTGGQLVQTLLFTVPAHICQAFAILGDSVLEFAGASMEVSKNILLVVIDMPFKVLFVLMHISAVIARLPILVLRSIPGSAYVGMLAILFSYMLYSRISFIRLVLISIQLIRNLWRGSRKLSSIVYGALLTVMKGNVTKSLDRKNRSRSCSPAKGLCVVCQEKPVSYIANPCSHYCLCEVCVRAMVRYDNRCPMCRDRVDHYAKVYVA